MLATVPPFSSSPIFHDYSPRIPSPLSPRSTNIYGPHPRRNSMSTSNSEAESEKSHKSAKSVPYAKRAIKKAPSPKPDELKERRRSLFLKKVKDEREDKRWEARGEDILRLDFMQRQRQWEAQLLRDAPSNSAELLDDEDPDADEEEAHQYELPTSISSSNAMIISAPSTQPVLDYEVDEVEQREREELEALLSYMPAEDEQADHLYSDDDYDALFNEIIEQENTKPSEPEEAHYFDEAEAMDTS